jgi:AraC-like DNA-binding protein
MKGGSPAFHFSTNELPERERASAWRECIGREMLRFDIAPLVKSSLFFEMTARTWAEFRTISVATSPILTTRTRALLADGDDNLCVLHMSDAAGVFAALGREISVGPGEAIVLPRSEVATFTFSRRSRVFAMHVPPAPLKPLLRDRDRALMRPIPAQTEAVRLLVHFVRATRQTMTANSAELRRLSVNYVYDLLALALGATRDAAYIAEGRGLRAARLRAIKDDIVSRIDQPDLSVGAVAKGHKISPRHLQRLFEVEGTTFSEFVRDQCLARAYRLLADPRRAAEPVGAIAYECGFGDLSHFNRAFRGLFGMSPTDARRKASERRE